MGHRSEAPLDDWSQLGDVLQDEHLARCTEDIDGDLVAAVRDAFLAEGADPLRPTSWERRDAAFARLDRDQPALLDQLTQRLRQAIAEAPEREQPRGLSGFTATDFLTVWFTQHVAELNVAFGRTAEGA
jgi:hypothetical protein